MEDVQTKKSRVILVPGQIASDTILYRTPLSDDEYKHKASIVGRLVEMHCKDKGITKDEEVGKIWDMYYERSYGELKILIALKQM